MAEINKFWVVNNYSGDDLFTDSAIKDDAHRLAHFCGALEDGGWSLHKMIRVYNGTGQSTWEKEKSKVYDNEADARKDAEARLKKARAKFEKGSKTASEGKSAMSELKNFQDSIIVRNIVAKVSMEHDSPEAMKKYLHDHPGADKSKHHVKKQDGGGGSGGSDEGGGSDDHSKANKALDNLEKKHPDFDKEDLAGWRKEVEQSKGDPKKLKKLVEEIEWNERAQQRYKDKEKK